MLYILIICRNYTSYLQTKVAKMEREIEQTERKRKKRIQTENNKRKKERKKEREKYIFGKNESVRSS